MGRSETFIPSVTPYGKRNTLCSFHRENEALSRGRGIGYCDLGGSETICDGDSRFCDKPHFLAEYFSNTKNNNEADESVQEHVKAIRGPGAEAATLRDTRNRRSCLRVAVALPLEFSRRNDSCPQAGVSGNIGERGLLIYSVFEDLRIGDELRIRIYFPNEYELDSFRVIARVIWKRAHSETDWRGYKYGAEFVQMSRGDREKLNFLLVGEMSRWKFDGKAEPGR